MSNMPSMDEFAKIMSTSYVIVSEFCVIESPEKGVAVFAFDMEGVTKCLAHGGFREPDEDFQDMLGYCAQQSEDNRGCLAFILAHNLHHWLEIKRAELQ